MKAREAMKP
jgi:activator of HSP90 ATPase